MSGTSIISGHEDVTGDSIQEAHQELNDSKKMVNKLLKFKRAMPSDNASDDRKFSEIKDQVVDAINQLFSDETGDED